MDCKGIICALDATEEVIKEAIERKCNMVIAHHPIIFGGLKKINGKNYVEKTIIAAIKNDIAIYAIHTNLDNVITGVNGKIAAMLGLKDVTILAPKEGQLKKLFTFVPVANAATVREAIFDAGAGHVGNYSECSFNTEGTGTFKAGDGTNPFVGKIGDQHSEHEVKIEVIFPAFIETALIAALKKAHPYEEVAYDIVMLTNQHQEIGAGIIGQLAEKIDPPAFVQQLKTVFKVPIVRHTALPLKPLQRIAVCGGAGSFLISKALTAGADAFVTGDMKYHEFFDANDRMVICDVGHYESEQFTIDLLQEILAQKFLNFAVLKTAVRTNPVYYS
jgi:dinuclear metal center YbgI/SA1388 family protein